MRKSARYFIFCLVSLAGINYVFGELRVPTVGAALVSMRERTMFRSDVFNDELTLDNLCSRQLFSRIPCLEPRESAATAEVTVKFTQTAMFYRHWTASMNVRNKRVSRCS